jgi:hypothetical protein
LILSPFKFQKASEKGSKMEEKVMEQFISLLEKGEFFEACEVLEGIWKVFPKKSERELGYRGLINGGVALELWQRRRKSYPKPWKIYHKYAHFYSLFPHFQRAVEVLNRWGRRAGLKPIKVEEI